MGEINARSQLGQPLHATVAQLDATSDTTAECVSLAASADSITPPLRAKLNIERTGGRTRLHIRSSSALNEPIVQFVLVSDCRVRLQCEHVVMLDPPAQRCAG